jgi:hypothetical protein
MLKSSDNERITRVGKGTPMGELMRRYWHPIAPANPMRTKEVRLLGEDLVLFRERGDRLALLDRFCCRARERLLLGDELALLVRDHRDGFDHVAGGERGRAGGLEDASHGPAVADHRVGDR